MSPASTDGEAVLKALSEALDRRGAMIVARSGDAGGGNAYEPVDEIDGEPVPGVVGLTTVLAAAWIVTSGDSERSRAARAHVEQLLAGIKAMADRHGGPVWINRTAWLLLRSYAETGAPPAPSEAQAGRFRRVTGGAA